MAATRDRRRDGPHAAVRGRARRLPRLRPRPAVRAAAVDRPRRPAPAGRCGSRSTTGRSPGTGGRGEAWLAARVVDGDADRMGGAIRDVLGRVDALARGEVPAAGRRPRPARRRHRRADPGGRTRRAGRVRVRDLARGVDAGRRGGARGDRAGRHLPGEPHPPPRGAVRRRPVAAVPAPADRRPGAVRRLPRPRPVARRPARRARCSPRSPEPFLVGRRRRHGVSTDPIKGTRPRGRTREQDRALARELLASAQGPGRERDDRGRAAQRPRPGVRAGLRAGAAAPAPRADGRRPAPRDDGDRAAPPRRRTRSTCSRPRSPAARSPARRRSARWS